MQLNILPFLFIARALLLTMQAVLSDSTILKDRTVNEEQKVSLRHRRKGKDIT